MSLVKVMAPVIWISQRSAIDFWTLEVCMLHHIAVPGVSWTQYIEFETKNLTWRPHL